MSLSSLFLGYFVAIVGGRLVIFIYLDKFLWPQYEAETKEERPKVRNITRHLGFLEAFTYVSAILMESPEWIPIWIGIKTASQWQRWSSTSGRVAFNIFLIGNLMCMLFSFLGAWIARGGPMPPLVLW